MPLKQAKIDKYVASPWNEYFDSKDEVELPSRNDGIFRAYWAGKEDSDVLIVFFHGGGLSSLSFAHVAVGCKSTQGPS
jgi:hypothetical protein